MSKAKALRIGRIAAPALLAVAASLTATHGVAQASSHCPAPKSDLKPDAVDSATRAALEQAAKAFPDRDTTGAYAAGATRSESGRMAQKIIKDCGVEVQRRTVVVDMVLPAMLPDSTQTFGSAAVSYVDGEYRVWQTSK